jgi:hypothetical protein
MPAEHLRKGGGDQGPISLRREKMRDGKWTQPRKRLRDRYVRCASHTRPASSRYRPDNLRLWGQLVREVISNVLNDLLNRFDAFRRRRAQSRFYRAEQGIAFALVIAALLGVGVLAARAIERSAADSASVTLSNAARVSSSSRREVITETVKRQGRTVRLVRHRPGTTVQETVTLPALTIRETHTITRREVATVTAIQQVTVTVRETVTCKPKSC